MLAGFPAYSLGSYDDRLPAARFLVTSVAITSNVATLGVTLVEGFAPIVGSLISVAGTQTKTSGGAPNFNVTNAALTAVSLDPVTGAGTVSFALSSSNIATKADAGEAVVPIPEVAEPMSEGQSGLQFAMASVSGLPSNSRDVSWEVDTPSEPDSFTAELQGAIQDVDAEYTTLDTMSASAIQTVLGVRMNFLRIVISALDGGSSPTVIGKILI
jgi:hypothetical protein